MKVLILSFILGCAELGVQSHRFGSRHDVDSFFSTFNVSGFSFQSIGLMTQPLLLSCLSSEQKQLEENCRTISLSAMVPMGSHGGFGGRGHRFHRHSSFVSVFGECILTKLGAYDNSTSSVNLDTLAINLINNTTLTDEQKLLAIANLNLCYTNTTAGVSLFHHHHEIINNVSRAIFCSSTALIQNGCATNTSGNSSAVAVAVSTQSLQMPIASYDGEASGEIKELRVHRAPECDEHGYLTESTTDDDSLISGYFDGYHAPRFLYRRRQVTRKPTYLCPNSTVSTTISSTTTEGNVVSTTTTISP